MNVRCGTFIAFPRLTLRSQHSVESQLSAARMPGHQSSPSGESPGPQACHALGAIVHLAIQTLSAG